MNRFAHFGLCLTLLFSPSLAIAAANVDCAPINAQVAAECRDQNDMSRGCLAARENYQEHHCGRSATDNKPAPFANPGTVPAQPPVTPEHVISPVYDSPQEKDCAAAGQRLLEQCRGSIYTDGCLEATRDQEKKCYSKPLYPRHGVPQAGDAHSRH